MRSFGGCLFPEPKSSRWREDETVLRVYESRLRSQMDYGLMNIFESASRSQLSFTSFHVSDKYFVGFFLVFISCFGLNQPLPCHNLVPNIQTMPDRDVVNLLLSNCVSGALYPATYVKVLMQIGFEPCPPQPGTSFFGKPILVLPGILGYSSHIYQRLIFPQLEISLNLDSQEVSWSSKLPKDFICKEQPLRFLSLPAKTRDRRTDWRCSLLQA